MPTSFDQTVSVSLENVGKRYKLGAGQESLRELVSNLSSRLLGRHSHNANGLGHFWALKDVNFQVKRGEAVGIVGPNGAGKTTILKLLSKVTHPTSGSVHIDGRFSSLIELGAGFHPDLTGRENIYLNGVILGLTQRQVQERFDKIVEFSELDRFIDMPVKRYSSGMHARLGFAVAAHIDPDVMLVDEVLAVGDASFQQKCYDFIHSFVNSGKTTVFVSHNLYVIEQLCNRVIWLQKGQIQQIGAAAEVLPTYLDSQDQHLMEKSNISVDSVDGTLKIVNVSFTDTAGNQKDIFTVGEDIVVKLKYRTTHPIKSPHFVLAAGDAQGGPPLFLASMLVDGHAPETLKTEGEIACRFKAVPLKPRAYQVMGEVWGADRARLLVDWQRLGMFRIVDAPGTQPQDVGKGAIRHLRADAPVNVSYDWEY